MTTRPYQSGIPAEILALSHERDVLRRRGQYARGENSNRRRLAGTVGTKQAEELTGLNVEVERFESYDIA